MALPRLRPKVAVISQSYPPLDGGVATSTRRVAQSLRRLGCEVMVLTFDYQEVLTLEAYATEEDDQGVQVHRIGPFTKDHELEDKFLSALRQKAFDLMSQRARAFAPDVILSFYASTAGLFGTYLSQLLGVPHIASLRGNDVGRNIFSCRWLQVLRTVVEGSAYLACVNRHLHQRLTMAFPLASAKSGVIMNGVDLPFADLEGGSRRYLSTHTAWSGTDKVAVFIGTPREKKGILVLLRALAEARQRVPLRLLVVGPELAAGERHGCGELWDQLRRSGGIHVTTQLEREACLRVAAEGDFIVMPSAEDGLANGLLEGMALGLCPIVSDIFSDVISSGHNGWMVERNNLPQLTEALVSAASAAETSRAYGARAREHVAAKHSPATEAQAYLRLFEEVIARAPGQEENVYTFGEPVGISAAAPS